MSDFIYLTADQVIAINEAHGGANAALISRSGVEGAVGRPQSGFGEYEEFSTVWRKAAALLHGIASTQYFSDGNKRTAWISAKLFLAVNGHPLSEVPTVAAECFVVAIALNAFAGEDIDRAAEWFERHASTPQDRLGYAFLAGEAEITETGALNAIGAELQEITAPLIPSSGLLNIVIRVNWLRGDDAVPHRVVITSLSESNAFEMNVLSDAGAEWAQSNPGHEPPQEFWSHILEQQIVAERSFDANEQSGLISAFIIFPVELHILTPGDGLFFVELDGQIIATLPLTIHSHLEADLRLLAQE